MKPSELTVGKAYYYNGEDENCFIPAGNVEIVGDFYVDEDGDSNCTVFSLGANFHQVVLTECLSELKGGK